MRRTEIRRWWEIEAAGYVAPLPRPPAEPWRGPHVERPGRVEHLHMAAGEGRIIVVHLEAPFADTRRACLFRLRVSQHPPQLVVMCGVVGMGVCAVEARHYEERAVPGSGEHRQPIRGPAFIIQPISWIESHAWTQRKCEELEPAVRAPGETAPGPGARDRADHGRQVLPAPDLESIDEDPSRYG